MRILKEAGLPDGVINFIMHVDGPTLGNICFSHRFCRLCILQAAPAYSTTCGRLLERIRFQSINLIRALLAETGGKDSVLVHKSANVDATVTALARGAFEFPGTKMF